MLRKRIEIVDQEPASIGPKGCGQTPEIQCVSKEQFGAIPVRAYSDKRLTGSHFRLLVAIAYRDRFSRNGYGCIATQRSLSEMTDLYYSDISKLARELKDWGYLKSHRSPLDKRRKIYQVIYFEQPNIVGRSTNQDNEIVGGENQQDVEIKRETSTQYIGLSPINKSCETGASDDVSSETNTTFHDVAPNITNGLQDAGEGGKIDIKHGEDPLLEGLTDFQQQEDQELRKKIEASEEKLRGKARLEIVDRLGGASEGWKFLSELDPETLAELEDKEIYGELTDADLRAALKAIKTG